MTDRTARFVRVLKGLMALISLLVIGLIVFAAQRHYFDTDQSQPLAPVSGKTLAAQRESNDVMKAFYRLWQLDFSDDNGNAVGLDDLRGKPFILLFWASWCPDCTEILPDVEQADAAARASGGSLQLVCRTGVRGENAETALDYLAEKGIPLRTWFDADGKAFGQLQLSWVPTALYFSPEGRLMLADTSGDLSQGRVEAGLAYAARGGLPATESFVRERLLQADGRVEQGFSLSKQGKVSLHTLTLSEGQGLIMQYALEARDKQCFDLAYGYARAKLYSKGMFVWKRDGGNLSDRNALLDDLRIIGSLLRADEIFGGYADEAMILAGALRDRSRGALVDWCALDDDSLANQLSLAYVDLDTLGRLASLDAEWAPLAQQAADVLFGGMLDTLPLYYPRFDLSTGTYGGEGFHAAEEMITLLHLAQADVLPDATRSLLLDWVRKGPVYARYTLDGQPAEGYLYESTAPYAIMVLIGCELKDENLILPSLYRMERARVISDGAGNGAYAYAGDDNKSFDTLCALLAWQAITSGGYLDAGRGGFQ
ncbi:MAG: TlpA family protein disulfide reductase [Christensenellales bacterium]